MNAVGKQLGVKVVPLIRVGCWFYEPDGAANGCPQFKQWVAGEITALKPRAVLVAGKFIDSKPFNTPAAKGLIAALSAWAALGTPVVLLGNTPTVPSDPKTCMATHPTALTKCSFFLTSSSAKWIDLKAVAKAAKVS